eukprot:PhM_4_TR3743/c0_g1_i1/m.28487
MDINLDSLNNAPLVGYALDTTHLHNVLSALVRSMDRTSNNVNDAMRRLDSLEDNAVQMSGTLDNLNQRLSRIENDLLGDEGRNLRSVMKDVQNVVNKQQQDIGTLARQLGDVHDVSDQTSKSVASLRNEVARELDGNKRDVQTLGDQVRSVVSAVQSRDLDPDRLRSQILSRVDALNRENNATIDAKVNDATQRLAAALEELNKRTLGNFQSTDIELRKLEDQCGALSNDIANIRADLNTVDNDSRHNLTRLRDDNDLKFAELLAALQAIEQGEAQLERQLAEAGRVLHQRRGNTQYQNNNW